MITTDVYFAAVLLSLGYELSDVDRTDARHMKFKFTSSKANNFGVGAEQIEKASFEEVKLQWVNRTIVVNAAKYMDSIKQLKSVIHSS